MCWVGEIGASLRKHNPDFSMKGRVATPRKRLSRSGDFSVSNVCDSVVQTASHGRNGCGRVVAGILLHWYPLDEIYRSFDVDVRSSCRACYQLSTHPLKNVERAVRKGMKDLRARTGRLATAAQPSQFPPQADVSPSAHSVLLERLLFLRCIRKSNCISETA